jgi:hypothetical protein
MSYTQTQAITKVRELINEASPSFWSDTEIEGWVKEAVIDISTKLLCCVAIYNIDLVANQAKYANSDHSWIGDCIAPKYVWYSPATGPVGMQKITPNFFGHVDSFDAAPKYYYYDTNHRAFWIHPTPDSTIDGEAVTVLYSFETDDITNLQDEIQPLTWLYAAAKAKVKERLYQESALMWNQYMDALNFERKDKYDLGVQTTDGF